MLLLSRVTSVKYIIGSSLCPLRRLHCGKSLLLQSLYSDEDQKKLLNFLNTMDEPEARKMRVRTDKYDRILTFRANHGQFSSLNDMLLIEGLQPRALCDFFNSILRRLAVPQEIKLDTNKKSNPKRSVKRTLANALRILDITPKNSVLTKARTIASFSIKENHFSWILLRGIDEWKRQTIEDWGVFKFPCERLQDLNMVQTVKNVNSVLPSADVYILEKEAYIKQLKTHYMSLQPQLTAIGITLICNKVNYDADRIYRVKADSPGRIFNLMVGKEFVSPQSNVTDFFTHGQCEETSNKSILIESLKKLSVSDDLRKEYLESSNLEREFMCLPLLVTKAFIEVMYQDR